MIELIKMEGTESVGVACANFVDAKRLLPQTLYLQDSKCRAVVIREKDHQNAIKHTA